MILYYLIGEIGVWKTEFGGGYLTTEVVLTSKCVYQTSLCLHAHSFQILVPATSAGLLTFCKWHLFPYCRSHLSCYTSVLSVLTVEHELLQGDF